MSVLLKLILIITIISAIKIKVQEIYASLSQYLQRAVDWNSEKGSSSWLTVLPFCDQGFHQTRWEFCNAIHFNMAGSCLTFLIIVCSKSFSHDQAMICHHGGLILYLCIIMRLEILQLNGLNVYAMMLLLSPHCSCSQVRLLFLPLQTSKILPELIYITCPWVLKLLAKCLFDVRVFYCNIQSYCNFSVPTVYRCH